MTKHNIHNAIPIVGTEGTEIAGKRTVVVETHMMTNKEIKETYFDKLVSYNGYLYSVVGVEVQGMPERIPGRTALMIKGWAIWN